MVSSKSLEKQLKRIHFTRGIWNRAEILELENILMPDEEIYECVNGTYEGGVALLCATDVRLLLIDKKPFKFLTVEDLRFDMINQIDYSHRLLGANISVSAGQKNLQFKSFNQARLRKLIGHIQDCMAKAKKKQSTSVDNQQQHLEQINQQLQAYLLAQYQQQQALREQLKLIQEGNRNFEKNEALNSILSEAVKPSPELSDYLYAQNLLKKYQAEHPSKSSEENSSNKSDVTSSTNHFNQTSFQSVPTEEIPLSMAPNTNSSQISQLYAAGMKEIFGQKSSKSISKENNNYPDSQLKNITSSRLSLEVNPLKIAYAKLPLVLRDRKLAIRMSNNSFSSNSYKQSIANNSGSA